MCVPHLGLCCACLLGFPAEGLQVHHINDISSLGDWEMCTFQSHEVHVVSGCRDGAFSPDQSC